MKRLSVLLLSCAVMATTHYSLPLLLVCLSIQLVEGSNQNTTNPTDENVQSAIEEKILGPIRIWHIVFMVLLLLVIVMVVVFCFADIRVPRSRQEIEENYKRRLLNQQYVNMLEKAPEQIMGFSNFSIQRKPEVAVKSTKENKEHKRNIIASSKPDDTHDGEVGGVWSSAVSMLVNTPGKHGAGAKPLAINPQDILAIMKQQNKTQLNRL